MHRILGTTVLLALTPLALAQTTVQVPCEADGTLYEGDGSLANGSGAGIFVGLNATGRIRRAVLRFDVAAHVPAGAVIVSAQVNLTTSQSTVIGPTPITGHRLQTAWGEGGSVAPGNGGGGTTSQTNDATWVHTFYPGATWTTPGGDFAATATLTASMPAFGAFSSDLSAATTADVQSWLDAPATNFGWVLIGDEVQPQTAHRINSRENTSSKPSLTVVYLTPGQNGTWGLGCPVGAGNVGVAWSGAPTGGNTIQVVKTGAPANTFGGDFYALSLDLPGTPFLPGCSAYLPLNEIVVGAVFPTDGAGAGTSSFFVPSGFPGYLIATQAAVLDGNSLGFVVSNAAVVVLQ
jgi:hypothetical protein